MSNNPALFDAVIAAMAGMNDSWLVSTVPANYVALANASFAIATEVDALIDPTTVSISRRGVMQSVVAAVMRGRSALSIVPGDYADIAQAIVAAYTEFATELQDTNTGAPYVPFIRQAILDAPIIPTIIPSDWTTIQFLSLSHSVIVPSDQWLLTLNMDMEGTDLVTTTAVRLSYSADFGAAQAIAGATTDIFTMPGLELIQANISVLLTGLTASDLEFRAQLMGGATAGTAITISRANIIVQKL